MILPNLALPSKSYEMLEFTGLDTFYQCLDKEHFINYPYKISYRYNSRGFRDSDWPIDTQDLQQSIWCIGDSFTVGIGAPYEHMWSQVLSKHTNTNTINISMDGASNTWISRRAIEIAKHLQPKNMVVMWSFIHRREGNRSEANRYYDFAQGFESLWKNYYESIRDPAWPECNHPDDFVKLPIEIRELLATNHQLDWLIFSQDLMSMRVTDDTQRRISEENTTFREDQANFKKLIFETNQQVTNHGVRIVHSLIPKFAPAWGLRECVELYHLLPYKIPYFESQDLGRDNFHFDINTAKWVAEQITPMLNLG